jgi:CHAT domain-containing protein/Tfp pilus assembly protein PilF
VLVDQKGIDAAVSLFAPDGKRLSEVDNEFSVGSESIFVVADVTGDHRLEVKSPNTDVQAGRYEIQIKELRQANSKDRVRVAAQKVFEEANQLRDQQTAESQRQAIQKYEGTLLLWREVEDRKGEAYTLNRLGLLYSSSGDPKKALEYYDSAVKLWRKTEDHLNEAVTLINIGLSLWKLGESRKALEYYSQALPLVRTAGVHEVEAGMLNNIATAYMSLSQQPEALKYLNQALSLERAIGHHRYEALTLNNMGTAHSSLGQLREALDYYDQALVLRRALRDRRGEAVTLNNIAAMHLQLGELQEALEYFGQVLPLRRAVGDRQGEAATLHNLGRVYFQLGESTKAVEYYNQALLLHRAGGDRTTEAVTLQSLSGVYQRLGELQQAREYSDQALKLSRAVGDRRNEVYELTDIGKIYKRLGELNKALEQFNLALSLTRTVGDRQIELHILNDIGDSYLILGDPKQALEYHRLALQLSRQIGNHLEEAVTLYGIARAQRKLGNLVEAQTQLQPALEMIEAARSKVVSQELRTSFLASYLEIYDFQIDLLMQMHRDHPSEGHDGAAYSASERARARSLLETLIVARADIRQGVDAGLLERERSMQQQLSVKSERLTRLLSGKHTEEQEKAAKKEVEDLLTDYQDVEVQIRAKSPRYAALTQPQPLSLKEVQQLLDKETLLLEYTLGEERSYLWAVTSTSIKSFELPKRSDIEATVRRFYELVTTRKNRELQAQREAAVVVARMLLGQVAGELRQKRLLIVSDGILHYIPFAVLPEPVPSDGRPLVSRKAIARYQPLVVKHEVVSLPSASVLAVVRRESAGRAPAPKAVAVLADPVFRSDDPRVKTSAVRTEGIPVGALVRPANSAELKSDVERSAWESGVEDLPRLSHSRDEAEAIVAQAQPGQSLLAMDFGANRSVALNEQLAQYRIVHFATHSLLNNAHPELSGIVLSLVDEVGKPQNGFVRLHEVYNLKLPAELVVLSGCRTALGKEVKGEGLVGLTRGFMYAGAARVMVSLWPVSDEGTAELMKRFYQGMLGKGLRPAAALRAAQVAMWKSKWWDAPYYWAGFVLEGEWR